MYNENFIEISSLVNSSYKFKIGICKNISVPKLFKNHWIICSLKQFFKLFSQLLYNLQQKKKRRNKTKQLKYGLQFQIIVTMKL